MKQYGLGYGGWMRFVAWVCVAGCTWGSVAGETPCDPLEPVVTQDVLDRAHVGEAADGTLYVMDLGTSAGTLYVSDAGVLVGHWVEEVGVGGASDGTTTIQTTSMVGYAEPESFVVVREEGGPTARMATAFGLGTGPSLDDVAAAGKLLTVVPFGVIAGMPAETREIFVVEYHAVIDGDEHVVVVRPRDGWDPRELRLFLGPADELAEREVYEVDRPGVGRSVRIGFGYHHRDGLLHFPYAGDVPGQATLTVGGTTDDVEWLDAASFEPAADAFLCF